MDFDSIKKSAEKAMEWGKEHEEEIKEGIEKLKDILPKKK